MPTVLNAANEIAVHRFLRDEIEFLEIAEMAEKAMEIFENRLNPSIEDIIETDREVRNKLM